MIGFPIRARRLGT